MHGLVDYLRPRNHGPCIRVGLSSRRGITRALGPELPTQVRGGSNREGLQWADKAIDAGVPSRNRRRQSASPAAVAQLVQLLRRGIAGAFRSQPLSHKTASPRGGSPGAVQYPGGPRGFPRVGVSVGAGTGKTLVAMERARRLTA